MCSSRLCTSPKRVFTSSLACFKVVDLHSAICKIAHGYFFMLFHFFLDCQHLLPMLSNYLWHPPPSVGHRRCYGAKVAGPGWHLRGRASRFCCAIHRTILLMNGSLGQSCSWLGRRQFLEWFIAGGCQCGVLSWRDKREWGVTSFFRHCYTGLTSRLSSALRLITCAKAIPVVGKV